MKKFVVFLAMLSSFLIFSSMVSAEVISPMLLDQQGDWLFVDAAEEEVFLEPTRVGLPEENTIPSQFLIDTQTLTNQGWFLSKEFTVASQAGKNLFVDIYLTGKLNGEVLQVSTDGGVNFVDYVPVDSSDLYFTFDLGAMNENQDLVFKVPVMQGSTVVSSYSIGTVFRAESTTPEPATLLLFGLGAVALPVARRFRKK